MIYFINGTKLDVLFIDNKPWFKIRDINKLTGTRVLKTFYTSRGYDVLEQTSTTKGGVQKCLYIDFYAVLCRLNYIGSANRKLIEEFISQFFNMVKERTKNTIRFNSVFD